ncbi:MAG: hypothetical protein KDH88_11010 [Chromatiales bacterium]|nr:hypothetical protein [Chromatiales bacterium]
MRIVDVEPQLLQDLIAEMQVTDTKQKNGLTVKVGLHPTLGRVVVVSGPDGHGMMVEME